MKTHRLVHIRLSQLRQDRLIKRRNVVIKRLNKDRNSRPKKARSNKSQGGHYDKGLYEAVAPEDFSYSNISKCISFIQNIDVECRKNKYSTLKVNLDRVKRIDAFGIALIISMLNKLSFRHIRYWGTYPIDSCAKQHIIESGFLELVKTNLKKPSNRANGNQLFMIGKSCVDSPRIGKAVRKAMLHLLGHEDVYPPVYDNMLEISANSVEHANDVKIEKNWLVSITTEANRLHFILADTGIGILDNLKKKKYQEVRDWLMKDDAEVLCGVFNKMYQSITGEINRHKGLPIVYESFNDGFISNLKVMTNKILVDFETNTSIKLKNGFKGVLYSWSVSIDNYNNWLNSL